MNKRDVYVQVDLAISEPSGILVIQEPATVLFAKEYEEMTVETLALELSRLEREYDIGSIRIDHTPSIFACVKHELQMRYAVKAPIWLLRATNH